MSAPVATQPAAAPEPVSSASKVALAGGVGGGAAVIYLIDRLLADNGQLAALMLTKLGPALGPIWASWPILALLLGVVSWAASKWALAQNARAAADAAAAAAAAELLGKVGVMATGLDGLRSEVHELRGALQNHADATDERLRSHDEGLRAVQGEVSAVRARVDVLERPPAKRRARA